MPTSAAFSRFKLTYDFGDDLGRSATHIDRDRMLIWGGFLQRRKLAVEQIDRHEVPVPSCDAPVDEVVRTF